MCYSELTECSKNPLMFYSAPPVFKERMKCVEATRGSVRSTRAWTVLPECRNNPPEVLKLHLPECRNNHPEVLKLHF